MKNKEIICKSCLHCGNYREKTEHKVFTVENEKGGLVDVNTVKLRGAMCGLGGMRVIGIVKCPIFLKRKNRR